MMADSEYQKMITCGPELRSAFQNHLLPLAEDLVAKRLISVDNQSEINNVNQPEPHRAARLLEFVRNKVKLSATYYHTFLEVLKKDEYKDILKIRETKSVAVLYTMCYTCLHFLSQLVNIQQSSLLEHNQYPRKRVSACIP